MAGVNKAIILGNLGRDPEMRYTQSGTPVATLSVATTRKYRRDDELVEDTQWHRVSVFGELASNCQKYLSTGRQIYVEGRLRTRAYHDRDNVKRYSTEIVAQTVVFLGSAPKSSDGSAPKSSDGGGDVPEEMWDPSPSRTPEGKKKPRSKGKTRRSK